MIQGCPARPRGVFHMMRARATTVLLLALCTAIACGIPSRAQRDHAYADALAMGGIDDSSLTIPIVGDFGYPSTTANPFAFRRLLRQGEFAKLDSLLSAAAESAHSDYHDETYLFGAYHAFEDDTSLGQPLDRWVRERPTSAPAHIARATYLTSLGWNARGARYAKDTPRQAMQRMHALFDAAVSDVDSAAALTPRSAAAYLVRLSVAREAADTAASRRFLMKGLDDIPASFWLRRAHMRNLIPRWGGSYEAMRAFADESEAMADSNPRLRVLRGFIALDYAEVWEIRHHQDEALKNYGSAMAVYDDASFHLERGQMLVRMRRYRDAMPDFDFAVAHAPAWSEPYLWRGVARQSLHEDGDDVLADYQHAVLIDPADRHAVDIFAFYYWGRKHGLGGYALK
jgi:tetratricopeptide (TPR) repeat protein